VLATGHDGDVTDRRDQTVLTTGANSGIGLATVLEVARRGYRTVGTVRSPEKADAVMAAASKAAAAIALWSRLTPTEIKDRLSRLVLGL
jgi:NAD(P)-dependent dehydrogenase (short-subunit alcohol dehydrogenase family)